MSRYAPNTPFNYLPHFYTDYPDSENAMSAAIYAASLAVFSLKSRDQGVTGEAWASYARALKQTNHALSSPTLCLGDDTLAAVLLLGLFEALFFSDHHSVDNWTAHTLGSAELLRMKGAARTQSEFGCRLVLHAKNNLHASYLQRRVTVPDGFQNMCRELNQTLPKCPLLSLGPLLNRLAYLQSQVPEASFKEGLQIAIKASQLDGEVTLLLRKQIAEAWYSVPTSVPLGHSSPVDILQTLRLNNYLRLIRISLNDLAQRCVRPEVSEDYLTEDLKALRASAAAILPNLCREILATCSHFVDSSTNRFVAAARCLILPLSLMYQMPWLLPESRREALAALSKLGSNLDSTSISQIVLALEATRELHWEVNTTSCFPRKSILT